MTAAHKKILLSGAAMIGVASIISRLLGIFRDRLLSTTFGAGMELDAYMAAFRIPDTIFNLVVVGALSSAFIPLFTEYLIKKDKRAAYILTNNLLNLLLLGLVAVITVVFFISPWLMELIGPGMDEATRQLTLNLTRIMLLSPLFFSISNIASGILNSYKKFFVYSLTPIMYNLGIIGGILFLAPKWGVYGVAVGVVIGSILHMAIQLPSVWKLGYRYKLMLDLGHKGMRQVFKLMIPRTLGLAVYQINLFISTAIASTVSVGAITIYNFANNLQSLPYSVFGISLSTTAFPILAGAASQEKGEEFISTLSQTIRRILFFVVPMSVLMLLLRAQIVRIILGAGAFDWEATILTASTLGYFVLSLFAQSLIPLLAKSFYAIQNTVIPVTVSIVSMVINIILALWFTNFMGVAGIALAFSIASFINMITLLIIIHVKLGGLEDKKIIVSVMKIIVASLVMLFLVQGLSFHRGDTVIDILPGIKGLIANVVDMQTFWGVFLQAAVATLVGLGVYVLVGWLIKLEEISMVKVLLRKFKRRSVKAKA
ncbi:murein biosynthesis integral membrane protein MurJ [Patescibacteria group bacterium]